MVQQHSCWTAGEREPVLSSWGSSLGGRCQGLIVTPTLLSTCGLCPPQAVMVLNCLSCQGDGQESGGAAGAQRGSDRRGGPQNQSAVHAQWSPGNRRTNALCTPSGHLLTMGHRTVPHHSSHVAITRGPHRKCSPVLTSGGTGVGKQLSCLGRLEGYKWAVAPA